MEGRPSWRSVDFVVLGLYLLFSLGVVREAKAQEFPYSAEEYEAYQKAVNSAVAKREVAIIQFIKSNPSSALIKYAVGSYVQLMQGYQSQGQMDKLLSAGERLLSVQPNDINALNMSTIAAYQKQRFRKVSQYGERVYAKNPSAGLAFILSNTYGQLKNEAKQVQYGEKACAEISPKDCYPILGELTRIFAARTQWSKAANYAGKTIQGFDAANRPAQTSAQDWGVYVKRQKAIAHAVLGRYSAERRRWGGAVSNYQQALKLYPSSTPLKAEAFYYVGMGRWKQNRMDAAMAAFASGSVQKGSPYARQSRTHLETLYKSTHNDSLAGVEEFISRTARR